jgi:hypothetical protein
MFGGDMTESGTDKQWQEWLEDWQKTISEDGRITPLIIARGNHERDNKIMVNLFDTVPSVYYSVTIGNDLLKIYTLNSEASIAGSQTDWLKDDLKASQSVIWKFAQYHRPMRPHVKSKSEGDLQYAYWAQYFYKYQMNVVVESDAHTVKATWPIKPSILPGNDSGFVRDDVRGTVYLGEGCWGAPLRTNDDNKYWTRASGRFNHFNWIFVDKSKVEIRTINVDNAPQVGSLTDESRFEIPQNINIWKPKNGDLIVINK